MRRTPEPAALFCSLPGQWGQGLPALPAPQGQEPQAVDLCWELSEVQVRLAGCAEELETLMFAALDLHREQPAAQTGPL